MRVAFQGEFGSNGHELCLAEFPHDTPVPCATFVEAFAAVRGGDCDLGLIAMENSAAGRVADVHHLLPDSGLMIVGERFKRVRFHLLANHGARIGDLARVDSHPMALAQCRRVIEEMQLRPHPALDTAGAARQLSAEPDPSRAVIATRLAADLYGLAVARENVEDDAQNTTRFVLVSQAAVIDAPAIGSSYVTSLRFETRDVPAALYKALGSFASNGVNMWKLESYTAGRGRFRSASFYVEIDGHPQLPSIALALEELGFFSTTLAILGVYEADPGRRELQPQLSRPHEPDSAMAPHQPGR